MPGYARRGTDTRTQTADEISGRECVQRRLACSVGVSPTGARVGSPVARIVDRRETDDLKPIDKAILGMVSESPGRNESERRGGPERSDLEVEPPSGGRRQHGSSQLG